MLVRIVSRLQQTSCALHLSISLSLLLSCMVSVPNILKMAFSQRSSLYRTNIDIKKLRRKQNLGCIVIFLTELYLLVFSFFNSIPQRSFGTLKPSPSKKGLLGNITQHIWKVMYINKVALNLLLSSSVAQCTVIHKKKSKLFTNTIRLHTHESFQPQHSRF